MRQRCEHGYVIDPEDRCPECERDALRRDNERLRAALRAIEDEHGYGLPPETRRMIRAALEDK